jgi:hypothetical protein
MCASRHDFGGGDHDGRPSGRRTRAARDAVQVNICEMYKYKTVVWCKHLDGV